MRYPPDDIDWLAEFEGAPRSPFALLRSEPRGIGWACEPGHSLSTMLRTFGE
jgi:hypothetical protein